MLVLLFVIILIIVLITAINWRNSKANCWHLQEDGFTLVVIHIMLSFTSFPGIWVRIPLLNVYTSREDLRCRWTVNNGNHHHHGEFPGSMLSLLTVRVWSLVGKPRFPQAAGTSTRTAYHMPGYSSKAGILVFLFLKRRKLTHSGGEGTWTILHHSQTSELRWSRLFMMGLGS